MLVGCEELGPRLHLFDQVGDDVGFCHAPTPLELDDLLAHERSLYRVLAIIEFGPEDGIDALCEVERVG